MDKSCYKTFFKFDCSFRDPMVEDRFLQEQWPGYAKKVRIVSLLTGLAYLGGMHGDYLTFGSGASFYLLLIARVVTFLFAMFCCGVTFRKSGYRYIQIAIFIYFMAIVASESIELSMKPGLGQHPLPFLLLVMIAYFLFFNAKLVLMLVAECVGALAYALTMVFIVKIPLNSASPIILTFLFVIALAIYFTRYMYRSKRLEYYSIKELHELNNRLQQEIEIRKKIEAKLTRISIMDDLTQIYNRRYFTELATREVKRAVRAKRDVSLLFLDLDRFKSINDSYGHDAGDKVLKKFAAAILANIRDEDIFARFGGEEFALLLPEITKESAACLANRLKEKVAQLVVPYKRKKISFTTSIGVASLQATKSSDLKGIIKNADLALYEAKHSGRNLVAVFEA